LLDTADCAGGPGDRVFAEPVVGAGQGGHEGGAEAEAAEHELGTLFGAQHEESAVR